MGQALSPADQVRAGRISLIYNQVFFGCIITGLRVVATSTEKTFATDGLSLFYNPNFVKTLNKREVVGVLAHEVMHIVLESHVRRGKREPYLWNVATDHAINLLLEDYNFILPAGVLKDKKFKEWTAERIYEYLLENPDEVPPKDGDNGWNIGGVMDAGTGGKEGETPDGSTQVTAGEAKMFASKARAQVRAASIAAKKAGHLPGNLARLIDSVHAPKADWRELLRRFVTAKAVCDWSFTQCHTRMLHQYGIISPVLDGESLGELALIVDTSGSVDDDQLAQFAGEISDILESYECKVTVIYCDTKVNRVEEFTQDDLPLQLSAVGGGGTLGKPAYDWVMENLEDVEAIVHYTDSFLFDWNKIDLPDPHVFMACTVDPRKMSKSTPDWCDVVDISEAV